MPKLAAPAQVRGSGPGGRIEISDIRSKLHEIKGGVDETTDTAKPYALAAGIAGVIGIIVLAFLFGRSRGRRKDTWVEIRRL
ncbi:MAG TPA: hypothetical protein VNF71_10065 [Acidimicrobiales bacterium]|nr:hypothetical protein [Acidimicrobiales bacterium]